MSEQLTLAVKWLSSEAISAVEFGTPLKTIEGLQARLTATKTQIKVSVGLSDAELSISEARWLFGRLIDHLKSLYPLTDVKMSRGRGVDSSMYEAISLDIVSRYSSAELKGLGIREDELKRLACLEAGYRQWVNEDPLVRTSVQIADDVLSYATSTEGVEAFVLDENELKAEGLNLHLAVGGASKVSPPRLVIATYGNPSSCLLYTSDAADE